MEMFTSKEFAPGIFRITDIATTKMYLVVGEKEAVLIDTGIGAGNIAEYVKTLTDKPLKVIITHGHVDHAMGSGTFGEEVPVYMSPLDNEIYLEHSNLALRQDYTKSQQFMRGLKGLTYKADKCRWYDVRPTKKLLPLAPGDTFDIGGEVLEIREGAGHTRGCITVLLQNHRMLLLGDACNNGIFLFDTYSCTVSEYKESMEMLAKNTDGRYDRTLLCHGPGDGDMTLVGGAIWLSKAILEGRDAHSAGQMMGKDIYRAKEMSLRHLTGKDIGDHSTANILYSDYTLK